MIETWRWNGRTFLRWCVGRCRNDDTCSNRPICADVTPCTETMPRAEKPKSNCLVCSFRKELNDEAKRTNFAGRWHQGQGLLRAGLFGQTCDPEMLQYGSPWGDGKCKYGPFPSLWKRLRDGTVKSWWLSVDREKGSCCPEATEIDDKRAIIFTDFWRYRLHSGQHITIDLDPQKDKKKKRFYPFPVREEVLQYLTRPMPGQPRILDTRQRWCPQCEACHECPDSPPEFRHRLADDDLRDALWTPILNAMSPKEAKHWLRLNWLNWPPEGTPSGLPSTKGSNAREGPLDVGEGAYPECRQWWPPFLFAYRWGSLCTPRTGDAWVRPLSRIAQPRTAIAGAIREPWDVFCLHGIYDPQCAGKSCLECEPLPSIKFVARLFTRRQKKFEGLSIGKRMFPEDYIDLATRLPALEREDVSSTWVDLGSVNVPWFPYRVGLAVPDLAERVALPRYWGRRVTGYVESPPIKESCIDRCAHSCFRYKGKARFCSCCRDVNGSMCILRRRAPKCIYAAISRSGKPLTRDEACKCLRAERESGNFDKFTDADLARAQGLFTCVIHKKTVNWMEARARGVLSDPPPETEVKQKIPPAELARKWKEKLKAWGLDWWQLRRKSKLETEAGDVDADSRLEFNRMGETQTDALDSYDNQQDPAKIEKLWDDPECLEWVSEDMSALNSGGRRFEKFFDVLRATVGAEGVGGFQETAISRPDRRDEPPEWVFDSEKFADFAWKAWTRRGGTDRAWRRVAREVACLYLYHRMRMTAPEIADYLRMDQRAVENFVHRGKAKFGSIFSQLAEKEETSEYSQTTSEGTIQ